MDASTTQQTVRSASPNLARREAEVERREAALAVRTDAAGVVLEAAEKRDLDADVHDEESFARDRAADLAAFMDSEGKPYGKDNRGRRHAALDPDHAKENRSLSAQDRQALTESVEFSR